MQADNPLWHAKHIFRILLLLIIAIVAIILGRSLLVPDTWGQFGSYRGANVAEQRAKALVHGGDASCKGCHEEQFAAHEEAEHATVRCEVCHAPVTVHATGNKKTGKMPTQANRELCIRCHRQLAARPSGFPQVQPRQHVDDNGGEWTAAACFDCHSPHTPL